MTDTTTIDLMIKEAKQAFWDAMRRQDKIQSEKNAAIDAFDKRLAACKVQITQASDHWQNLLDMRRDMEQQP